MGEEIRRSGRATKGQHTKNAEDFDPEPSKRVPKGKGSKGKAKKADTVAEPEAEDEEDFVRCVCGATEEDDDEAINWVQCDKCNAWQHTDCIGMSTTDFEERGYYCEQCRPQDHKELLTKIKRGERPWEEAKQKQEEAKRKKGKRGRKSRASEVKVQDGLADTASADAAPEGVDAVAQGRQKRKHAEDKTEIAQEAGALESQNKIRKLSSPSTEHGPGTHASRRKSGTVAAPTKRESKGAELQTMMVENISELRSESRRRIAEGFVKLCTLLMHAAQKEGSFTLPEGQSFDAFCLRLSLSLEYALCMNYWGTGDQPTENYQGQYRRLNANLKSNSSLRNSVLNSTLSPNELAKMSTSDMASKEQKEKEEKIRKESAKQHVLVQDATGPRTRRTHKGEEVVGDVTDAAGASDSVFSSAPVRRRDSEIDPDKKSETPTQTPVTPHIPQFPTGSAAGSAASPGAQQQKQPLAVDTKATVVSPPASGRPSSAAFDLDNVFSSVGGQRSGHRAPPPTATTEKPEPPSQLPADVDIDRMLGDEEEEPYSPTDNAPDPDAPIWQGELEMAAIAQLNAVGRFAAGANLSAKYPWKQLMPPKLAVKGRIPVDKASEYLCNLRYSSTCDVSVVALTAADDENSRTGLKALCEHLTNKTRFGVIADTPVADAKDTYLVPLPPDKPKPEFLQLLVESTVPDTITEHMLLVVFVFRVPGAVTEAQPQPTNGTGLSSDPSSVGPAPVASTPVGPQASPFPPGPYPQQHTAMPTHSTPSQQSSMYYPPATQSYPQPQGHQSSFPQQQQQQQQGLQGIDGARQVLTQEQLECASTIQFLQQAPMTNVAAWKLIKGIYEETPAAKDNFELLASLLAKKVG